MQQPVSGEPRPGSARGAIEPIPQSPADSAPATPPAGTGWTQEHTRVAVGLNVNVSGKLIFHEPVRIEGRFRGEVRSDRLVVIAEGGMIDGVVSAPRLVVMGELRGDATGCERVMIGPHARVLGNLETRNLEICAGAWLDGHVRTIGASGEKDG